MGMRLRAITITHQILAIVATFILVPAFAQDQQPGRGNDGEIEDLQIEIIKERQITPPPANRTCERIPPPPAEQTAASVNYDFRPCNLQSPEVSPRPRPSRLRPEH